MRLADGRVVPIENIESGDVVASLDIPGLERDADYPAQFEWLRTVGTNVMTPRAATVGHVRHGEHDGCYVINGRIKATFEHPFLVRRRDQVGFCSAELLRPGDFLIRHDLSEEFVASVQRVDAPARTVALLVPGTNLYIADGVWVHNQVVVPSIGESSASGSGGSGSGGSGSGSGSKGSGSSFGSGSGSGSGSSSGSGSITIEY